MLEKGREVRRNDPWIETQNKFVKYIACTKLLRGCVFIQLI